MSNHLKSLRIEGFKCFSDITVPMERLTVLAGGNSVGKSTVIQSLLLMRSAWSPFSDPRRFPDGPVRSETSKYESRVLLNGSFLLNLNSSRGVVTNGQPIEEIRFSIENHQNQLGIIPLEVPLEEENYLLFKGMIAEKDPHPLSFDIRHNPLFHHYSFYYLNAERLGPRVFYDLDNPEMFATGWQGEYTIKILASTLAERYQVNEAQSFERGINLQLGTQTNFWIDYILSGVSVQASKLANINKAIARINTYSPHNVGFGISYTLPIVVSGLLAKPNTMLIVENPEAHLHPLGQSRIGQFLAQMAAAGVQVIIETHSEHVINGIRIATLKEAIRSEEVAINFFNRDTDGGVKVTPIHINESGDLSAYPKGFFDQEQRDMAEIIREKRKRIEIKP